MRWSRQAVIDQYVPATPTPGIRGDAFAPSNIALCKYWGKRDTDLNLPINGSLSVSLGNLGSHTEITPSTTDRDQVLLNGELQALDSRFSQKVVDFVSLFRKGLDQPLRINTHNSIPTAAGLASSASGFAALMLALNDFYTLQLAPPVLSAFARMGSGSAARSIYTGFVEWHKGENPDGMDSHATPLTLAWPDFRIAIVKVHTKPKTVDSRAGMQRTVTSAALYQAWPDQAARDLGILKQAIHTQDFSALGQTAEHNALSMHATMIASQPPLLYWLPESVALMQRVWTARNAGLEVYFTMDAGPNIKLLFLGESTEDVRATFPELAASDVIAPFDPAMTAPSQAAFDQAKPGT